MLMMIILTIVFLVIDIVSKLVVSNLMNVYDSIVIIKNFFYISYVRNTGAAWSIFSNNTWFVILISLLIIGGIIIYILKNKPKSKLEKVGYSMILGGALGNLIDRVIYGYVIDFLDFYIFGYDYPIFNLADTFIVIGVILLLIYTWRCKDGN
jgi:signal peptidase II